VHYDYSAKSPQEYSDNDTGSAMLT